jgi:hypothetical protein
MAIRSACSVAAAAVTFCRPEEVPFLLLEITLRAVQEILLRRRGLVFRRTWNEQPYGGEVLQSIQQCLARIDELDGDLESQQEAEIDRLQSQCSAEIELAMA